MPKSTRSFPLVGRKIAYVGSETIDPDFLADEAAEITITEGTTEIPSQSGTRKIPNGSFDEISATLTVHIPNVRFLGKLFPNLYKKASFNYGNSTDPDGETGVVQFGLIECKTVDPIPIVIHNVCDADSSQDIRFPQGLLSTTIDATVSLKDPFDITLTITPLSGTGADIGDGAVEFGEGDLSKPTLYNPETQKYEAIPDES